MGAPKTTSRVKESASSNFWDSSEDLRRFREMHEPWIALGYGGEDGVTYSLQPEHFNACLADDDVLRRGDLSVNTPWHFPVLNEDRLGGILQDVYFWEQVLCRRYSKKEQVHKFKTQMESVLAGVVGLSVARVQKLRKWLHTLQSGRLGSLAGKR